MARGQTGIRHPTLPARFRHPSWQTRIPLAFRLAKSNAQTSGRSLLISRATVVFLALWAVRKPATGSTKQAHEAQRRRKSPNEAFRTLVTNRSDDFPA